MTAVAKLLVFVNVFFGVGLLAWAVAATANRVDYLDTTDGTTPVKGKISELKAEIEKVSKAIADAQAGYNRRRSVLAGSELRRDDRRRVYAKRLDSARAGRFRQQLTADRGVYGDGVFTDTTREGPDLKDADGQPLVGLKTLEDKFAAETRAIETLEAGRVPADEPFFDGVRAGTVSLDTVAARQPELGINDLRRLHSVLSDLVKRDDTAIGKTRDVKGNLAEERAFLADRRVNVGAELQTLELRRKQLTSRIKSLTTTAQK